MKTFVSFVTLAIAATVASTDAAVCTPADIAGATKLPEYPAVMSACGNVDFMHPVDGAATICAKAACVDALRAYAKALPKCDVNGMSFTATLELALDKCKSSGGAGDAPTMPPTPTVPAMTTTTPTTTTKAPTESSETTTEPPQETTTKPTAETSSPQEAGAADGSSTSAGSQSEEAGASSTMVSTTKPVTAATPAPTTTKESAATSLASTAVTAIAVAVVCASVF